MTNTPLPADDPAAPAPAANRWDVPAADHAARRAGPVWGSLDDWRVLEIDGDDAVSFFQGQSTVDIAAMTGTSWQLGGYCSAKGRLLAVYQAWRTDAGLALLVPADIAAPLSRRLSMFVLRAKATVRDAGLRWRVYFVLGAGAGAALAEAGVAAPAAVWQCGPVTPANAGVPVASEARVARLPGGAQCGERFLVVERSDQPAAAMATMETIAHRLPRAGAGLWHWSQIDAGIPDVFAATQERFVPQAVNLEVLGGVNFRKGCYPGQEVVARSQYLGKLRRRLALVRTAALGPGDDVFLDGPAESAISPAFSPAISPTGSPAVSPAVSTNVSTNVSSNVSSTGSPASNRTGNPIGHLVQAASVVDADGIVAWDALIECPTEASATGILRIGAPDAPPAELRPLPYPIFDPTA